MRLNKVVVSIGIILFSLNQVSAAALDRSGQSISAFLQPNHYFEFGLSTLDPDISGETIVPISCLGSTEQTQEITMNGNFTAYLNDVKLNQQPMSVSTLRTLLAAYGLEIEIISE